MTPSRARSFVFAGAVFALTFVMIPRAGSNAAFHATVDQWVGPRELARARSLFELMSRGQVDSGYALRAPELREHDSTRAGMQAFADLVAGLTLDSVTVIGLNLGR